MAILRIAVLVISLSMATGLALRSVQQGRLAVRPGLAWGAAFALGMLILALPGMITIVLLAADGWPIWLRRWHDANPGGSAQIMATIVMILGGLLAWFSIPGLTELEKKWRGGK